MAVNGAINGLRKAYSPFGTPTDTLVTKVLLGTLGCLPACDRYFVDGFRDTGNKYSYLNSAFVNRVFQFCRSNLADLRKEQARIRRDRKVYYPLMKLVDMYFHEIGYELDG